MQTQFDQPENVVVKPLVDIKDVQPLTESDKPLIDDLVSVLRKHNALDRIGIILLHQHFDILDDEVLLETTDILEKTQMIRPVKKDFLQGQDTVSTAWRLDSGVALMSCTCLKDTNGNHAGHYDTSKSDKSLKDNIVAITDATEIVNGLEPVAYFYKSTEHPELNLPHNLQFGLIAQDLEKVLPHLVFTTKHVGVDRKQLEFKNINYQGLVPLLIQAVKEQNETINELKNVVQELQQQLALV